MSDAYYTPTVLIPQGDHCYSVRPGRPVRRLDTAQLAAEFGVSASTVRRWVDEGIVPAGMVTRCGLRKLSIDTDAIGALRRRFAQ